MPFITPLTTRKFLLADPTPPLRSILTILTLIAPVSVDAAEAMAKSAPKPVATSLLPDGSEMKEMLLPRFDPNQKLDQLLKAKKVTLIHAGQFAGETVSIELFNPDTSPRVRIDLETALIDQTSSLVSTKKPVQLQTARMQSNGSGLYYEYEQNRGFMTGPVTTVLHPSSQTTTMQNPTKTLRATAAIGMALISQPLHASPPTALKPPEVTALRAEANAKSPVAATAMAAAHASLNADLTDSAAATQAANSFIAAHQVPPIGVPAPSAAHPLEVKPSLNDTVIQCEGGVYFDAEEGVLVYLKNVTVKDPRFDLSGADELKIFFAKKPAKPEGRPNTETIQPGADGKPKAAKSPQVTLGNPERIVATGAVRIDQKSTEGKEPIKASGAIFRYNIKSDEAILSGGYPWFIQGTTFMRAKEPNLILRIFPKTGSFVTEGNWEMGGNIQEKR